MHLLHERGKGCGRKGRTPIRTISIGGLEPLRNKMFHRFGFTLPCRSQGQHGGNVGKVGVGPLHFRPVYI